MNNYFYERDTIAAIATAVGSSGIGIIRISGPQALEVSEKIFFKKRRAKEDLYPCRLKTVPSHHLQYGYICDPKDHVVIDEVLLAVMKAPHSYTMEDVVEIQSHCGPAILAKILEVVLQMGTRMALPGEFTKRAFLNGRIDLSQAEAVADMVNAKSESGLKISASHLAGHFKNLIFNMIEHIQNILVHLEASLEFSEDVETSIDRDECLSMLEKNIITPVEEILRNYIEGHYYRDGVRLGIVGRPNVGKSSLLNYLLKRERAIVTPIPGTTRDVIEEPLSIGGLPVVLTDTAGLHHTKDPVEVIGIKKTHESIDRADLVLFMVDGCQPFTEEDSRIFKKIVNKKIILVINKLDLIEGKDSVQIENYFPRCPNVFISAKYGDGVEQLKEKIKNLVVGNISMEPGKNIIPNLRQKASLENILGVASEVIQNIKASFGEEFIISDLNRIKDELKKITGESENDDILDAIFSRFCIGK